MPSPKISCQRQSGLNRAFRSKEHILKKCGLGTIKRRSPWKSGFLFCSVETLNLVGKFRVLKLKIAGGWGVVAPSLDTKKAKHLL